VNVGDVLGPGFSGLSEEQRLERTARELETVLVTQLLKTMRETVPEGGLFGKSLADDVFRSMLDEQIARATSEKSPFGLADAVVESLRDRIKNAGESTESAKEGASLPARGEFRRIG
jgi:flagellar protein FlgJ